MRAITRTMLAAATAGCLSSCGPKPAAGDQLVARYHFQGATRLAAAMGGQKAKDVAKLAESQALLDHALRRLAAQPQTLLGSEISTNATAQAAPLVQALFDDLVREESFLEITRREGRPFSWTLGVAVRPERAGVWRTNVAALVKAWGLGEVIAGTGEGLPAAEVMLAGGRRVRWVEGPGWFLVGAGEPPLPGMGHAQSLLKTTGRPVSALTNAWLEVTADLKPLAALWGWAPSHPWPRAELAWAGRDEDLRTEGRIVFPEKVTGPLAAWRVPTNLVVDPLVGFTAMRGVAPLAARFDLWKSWKLDPVPNEFYLWSQGAGEFQSFIAFPMPDPTNQLRRATAPATAWLAERMPPEAHRLGFTNVTWGETNSVLAWRGMPPLIAPHLRPMRDVGTDYLVGALFPGVRRRTFPTELLSQIQRSNLVYYQWEITETRLLQSRTLSQLASVILDTPQLSTNLAGMRWLMAIEPRLGNAVTELTAVSPREWSLVRRSHIGLTSVELVALARWLESAGFPRPGLVLPEPLQSPAKPARAAAPTPRSR